MPKPPAPRLLFPVIAALIVAKVAAVDAPAPVADQPAREWTNTGKLGAFLSSIGNSNAATSNDPAIASTKEKLSYQIAIEDTLTWKRGDHGVVQSLVVKYGEQKQERQDFAEDTDQIDYDGAYSYLLGKPHFVYLSWGLDTNLTEPDPGDGWFEPGVAKIATGYGQRYENLLPKSDKLEFRLGVRGQQRYGRFTVGGVYENDFQVGPEFTARYERKHRDDLRYWIQFEAFGDFEDIAHVTNLLTAGLDLQVSKWLTVSLGLRAYYETEPDDVDPTLTDTYDSLSYRTEVLVGLTYLF